MDLGTRPRGVSYSVCGVYSSEPGAEVHSLQLNFKRSKLANCPLSRLWLKGNESDNSFETSCTEVIVLR